MPQNERQEVGQRLVVLKQSEYESQEQAVGEQEPGREQSARHAPDERAEGDGDVVRDDPRRRLRPVFLLRLRVTAALRLVLCGRLGARHHARRQQLVRQRGPLANHHVADSGGNREQQEREQHVPPRLHHRRGEVAQDVVGQWRPLLAACAVQRVVPRRHDSLEIVDHAGVDLVGAGPRKVGGHLAVLCGEGRNLSRRQRPDALEGIPHQL